MCDGTHSLIDFLLARQSFQQLSGRNPDGPSSAQNDRVAAISCTSNGERIGPQYEPSVEGRQFPGETIAVTRGMSLSDNVCWPSLLKLWKQDAAVVKPS